MRSKYNIRKYCEDEGAQERHDEYLPNQLRMLVCGGSGMGKTNFIACLLEDGHIEYSNLIIITPTTDQLIWKKMVREKPNVEMYDPDHLPRGGIPKNTLVIFDDYINEKSQSLPQKLFSKGRHDGIEVIYLTQTYIHDGLKDIKRSVNSVILFGNDMATRQQVHERYLNSFDITLQNFKRLRLYKHDYIMVTEGKYITSIDEEEQIELINAGKCNMCINRERARLSHDKKMRESHDKRGRYIRHYFYENKYLLCHCLTDCV